jgi:hypothetical protein
MARKSGTPGFGKEGDPSDIDGASDGIVIAGPAEGIRSFAEPVTWQKPDQLAEPDHSADPSEEDAHVDVGDVVVEPPPEHLPEPLGDVVEGSSTDPFSRGVDTPDGFDIDPPELTTDTDVFFDG